jgi:hypothetical protein
LSQSFHVASNRSFQIRDQPSKIGRRLALMLPSRITSSNRREADLVS